LKFLSSNSQARLNGSTRQYSLVSLAKVFLKQSEQNVKT
jgi:hypothetical protein